MCYCHSGHVQWLVIYFYPFFVLVAQFHSTFSYLARKYSVINYVSSYFAAVHSQGPILPACCGLFELNTATNTCVRPSCYNTQVGPISCPIANQALCVCKGYDVYNPCTQKCIPKSQCPPLPVVERCMQTVVESFSHCD